MRLTKDKTTEDRPQMRTNRPRESVPPQTGTGAKMKWLLFLILMERSHSASVEEVPSLPNVFADEARSE